MPPIALGLAGNLGDIAELVAHTTLLGKIVLLILLFMSVFSWALMVERWRRLARAAKINASFWEQFNAGHEDAASLDALMRWSLQHPQSPLAAVFAYFSREFWPGYRARRGDAASLAAHTEVLARGVDRVATAEMGKLERGLSWLATFTSTAPFIGLLGTVYGILTSFLEIGRQGSASLDAVGPGIAESLIATVAGLAVAIPAAVGYNYFVSRLKLQDAELQALGAQLSDVLTADALRGARSEAPRERSLT
ncbi:MAG: MotA/TolQ/ExbB proton channel family protein [Candidatus Krumholzibacteriia bacterium]|nr:MotA/TolQ/ExbB proton channel family protein [bacterium]MCB9516483.1 MotA/TolQ/ExbB proton channel family protein [Candidatus Latescibacterota bacterium]